jgi:predicted MFS family arabinose efflux permease
VAELARVRDEPAPSGRLTLWVCSALHTVNDAFFAVIFPLLPLLAAELHLSYAEVGLVKTAFSTASAAFQLPVGLLAERWGDYALLVWGNGWVALGLIGMATAGAYLPLLALTVLAGLGGNTQHPLAAGLVSRRVSTERRATAIGTLNFAGDLGKMLGPPLVALVAIPFGWRTALAVLGAGGLVFSLAILRLPVGDRRAAPADARARQTTAGQQVDGWGLLQPRRYTFLAALGMLDSSTRGAALAFLPFLLLDKGLDASGVSWLFTVVFVGGALGKFGCGWLGDRLGSTALIVTTELVTVAALALFPSLPLLLVPLLALAFGFVLNGTSSVLYATVAELVDERRRSRGYGLYYTLVNGASALAPVLYGLLGDRAGLLAIFAALAATNLLTVPLAFAVGMKDEGRQRS